MKMEQKEYIILCLEDSNDWSNATTRRLVMQARAGEGGCREGGVRSGHTPQAFAARGRSLHCCWLLHKLKPCTLRHGIPPQVDPTLSRTVVVSTKLDTRIPQVGGRVAGPACISFAWQPALELLASWLPSLHAMLLLRWRPGNNLLLDGLCLTCPLQFARSHDVEMYLRPPSRLLEPTMLGGSPFFTCVFCGGLQPMPFSALTWRLDVPLLMTSTLSSPAAMPVQGPHWYWWHCCTD